MWTAVEWWFLGVAVLVVAASALAAWVLRGRAERVAIREARAEWARRAAIRAAQDADPMAAQAALDAAVRSPLISRKPFGSAAERDAQIARDARSVQRTQDTIDELVRLEVFTFLTDHTSPQYVFVSRSDAELVADAGQLLAAVRAQLAAGAPADAVRDWMWQHWRLTFPGMGENETK